MEVGVGVGVGVGAASCARAAAAAQTKTRIERARRIFDDICALSAFPYAGSSRIRFRGVISGPLGPPPGRDQCVPEMVGSQPAAGRAVGAHEDLARVLPRLEAPTRTSVSPAARR